MKKMMKGWVVALGAAMIMPTMAKAQDKFTVSAKADFVSDYVWRGQYQNSGFSIQPNLALAYKGVTLAAWGNQSLTTSDGAQEFDINLSYAVKGFGIMVSDYWWNGVRAPYGYYKDGHHFEATLSYNFKECCNLPLTLSWSTWFAGADDNKIDDNGEAKRAYSTYINAAYDIACPYDITLTPSVGFTPWEGVYYKRAAVTDISLKASKAIQVTDHFSIPLFVQAIVAPNDPGHAAANGDGKVIDKTYLIAGFSIGF